MTGRDFDFSRVDDKYVIWFCEDMLNRMQNPVDGKIDISSYVGDSALSHLGFLAEFRNFIEHKNRELYGYDWPEEKAKRREARNKQRGENKS